VRQGVILFISRFAANCLMEKPTQWCVKDAISVSFRSDLFTTYILIIFKQRNLLPYIWETANYSYPCMQKYYRKNEFVENIWPANLDLFIYVSTHCVETVKYLDFNRYSQLTRWCSGNASALGARGPGFNSIPFYVWFFVLLLLCFYFLFKNTLFITILCNSLFNVYLFSILNILTYFWPIIRV